MRLVLISDTHGFHRSVRVPNGDVLIHAGDFTKVFSHIDLASINEWFGELPHKNKIIIAGNHDSYLEKPNIDGTKLFTNATYLFDTDTIIDGIKFYGSPWQPEFFNWSFNLPRGEKLKEKWDLIPIDTDVLITHSPPYGILDITNRGDNVGCDDLFSAVKRISPKLHVFGHIHEGYGLVEKDYITYVNASICTNRYKPINAPIIFDI